MHTTMSEAGLVFFGVRSSPHHIHCQNVKDAVAKNFPLRVFNRTLQTNG